MTNEYSVILADPPWYYNNRATRASADKHYPTMTMEETKALPVRDLGAMPCVLFLWVTWPNMPAAFDLLDAWHFEYKTLAWEWLKTYSDGKTHVIGLGNYTRANVEPCILAFKKKVSRGKIMRPDDKSIRNILIAKRRRHSQKPDEQYDRIERMYPDMPKIELFARQPWPGWECWGDDVEGSIKWP